MNENVHLTHRNNPTVAVSPHRLTAALQKAVPVPGVVPLQFGPVPVLTAMACAPTPVVEPKTWVWNGRTWVWNGAGIGESRTWVWNGALPAPPSELNAHWKPRERLL